MAARKLASLLAAGAEVRLVSPELHPETAALAARPGVELAERAFRPEDLAGAALVVAAARGEVNRRVADLARAAGVWVNVVDDPGRGDFLVPASFRRGELTVAVSTGGASPAVARRVRQQLEQVFGPAWGPYLRLLARVRARLLEGDGPEAASGVRPAGANRDIFYRLADSDLLDLVAQSDAAGVEALLSRELGPGWSLAHLGLEPGDLLSGSGNGEED